LHCNKWLCPLWSQSSSAWISASWTYLWNANVALEEWAAASACTKKYMPHPLQGLSWWLKDPVSAVTYWLWKRIQRHIRWHTGIVRVSLSQVLIPAAALETEHLVTRKITYFSNVLQHVNIQRLFILSSRAFRKCEMCTDLLLFNYCIILHLAFNCWESAFYSVSILVLYFILALYFHWAFPFQSFNFFIQFLYFKKV
jgi:hypothetical protein